MWQGYVLQCQRRSVRPIVERITLVREQRIAAVNSSVGFSTPARGVLMLVLGRLGRHIRRRNATSPNRQPGVSIFTGGPWSSDVAVTCFRATLFHYRLWQCYKNVWVEVETSMCNCTCTRWLPFSAPLFQLGGMV